MNIPEDHLAYLRIKADTFGLKSVCDPIFTNPKFVIWSGSSKPFQHHYGKGGLIIHTSEVVKLMLEVNCILNYPSDNCEPICSEAIFLAGLFHDVGKMWDYKPVDQSYKEWESTEHKREIHHITRSAIVWMEASSYWSTFNYPINEKFRDKILHAILAHHGSRQAGSPVFPKTKLAWLLHLCDGLSARMNDADKNDYLGEFRK